MKIKHRVVVFPDIHFPNEDKKAFACALNVLEKLKPNAFLLLGDFADGESVGLRKKDHLLSINYHLYIER